MNLIPRPILHSHCSVKVKKVWNFALLSGPYLHGNIRASTYLQSITLNNNNDGFYAICLIP
ncbi:hypothetical protein MTR_7g095110 [Medicago truncatula]|uniref:Uncharacterized protein n=1 Tax=Medicago truncatula TaxID=3880 RepID=A0A072U255_MEDTR|nr:hypothetical protein MTR_7g095110 [Medicago truncatula]